MGGLGAVGKSFYEKIAKEIQFNKNKYYVITRENDEFEAYINLGGLVSHFVKAAIEYVVNTQFKKDKHLKALIKKHKFNEAAQALGIRMIHVNDIDLQEVKEAYSDKMLFSKCCFCILHVPMQATTSRGQR